MADASNLALMRESGEKVGLGVAAAVTGLALLGAMFLWWPESQAVKIVVLILGTLSFARLVFIVRAPYCELRDERLVIRDYLVSRTLLMGEIRSIALKSVSKRWVAMGTRIPVIGYRNSLIKLSSAVHQTPSGRGVEVERFLSGLEEWIGGSAASQAKN